MASATLTKAVRTLLDDVNGFDIDFKGAQRPDLLFPDRC